MDENTMAKNFIDDDKFKRIIESFRVKVTYYLFEGFKREKVNISMDSIKYIVD
jgi:hypothetical protein